MASVRSPLQVQAPPGFSGLLFGRGTHFAGRFCGLVSGTWDGKTKRNEVDLLHGLMFASLFCPELALVREPVGLEGDKGDVVPFQGAGIANSFVPLAREAISP